MAIAFIPLRGGSKSIPLKNIKLFCGRPLCYWAIAALEQSTEISKIVVATDSEAIKTTVNAFGFQKVSVYDRDPENAADTSSTESVMLEFLAGNKLPDTELFVLVQATNPFILSADITNALAILKSANARSLLTCVRYKRFFWNEDGTPRNYDYRNRPRRQNFKGDLMENGAFYISSVGDIRDSQNRLSGKIAIYEMPEYSAFEIDEPDDWFLMERLFKTHILDHSQGQSHLEASNKIRVFISDVDGVMTDAGMYYSESGDEFKKFNTHDGMGLALLRKAGIKTAIVTSEDTKMVENRGRKLKVDYVYQGRKYGSKLEAALEICQKEGISINQVAYIGDDVNCFDLLSAAGIRACPVNALPKIMSIPGIIKLEKKGGDGVVREFIELLFNKGLLDVQTPPA